MNGTTICITALLLSLSWLCWRSIPSRGECCSVVLGCVFAVAIAVAFIDLIYTVFTVTFVIIPLYLVLVEDQSLCDKETFVTACIAAVVNLLILPLLGVVCLCVTCCSQEHHHYKNTSMTYKYHDSHITKTQV